MATIEIGEVEIYYDRAGSGETIVMTHGAWSDAGAWEAVSAQLEDRFEIVAWDRRGHSRSSTDQGPGSCRQDASDLAALIERIADGPVHLVGNSAGGTVVLNLMTMRPELVRSVSAHEPGPFGLLLESSDRDLRQLVRREMELTEHVEELIASGSHEEAARFFVEEVAVGPGAWKQFPEELRRLVVSNAATVPDDLRDGWDISSVDIEALSTLTLPLLITTGTNSPQMEAAAARELVDRVPYADIMEIPGAGHIPHRTHPDEYARVLAEFIASAGSPPPLPRTEGAGLR